MLVSQTDRQGQSLIERAGQSVFKRFLNQATET